VSKNSISIEKVAEELRIALESADLAAFSNMLAPDVTWGPPGANSPTCQSKNQVLTWYERGRSSGASAKVCEITIVENRVLVGLLVRGLQQARDEGDEAERWQVFTTSGGRIVDIVGFDRKSEAVEWLSST
jgi:hypothetical protein